MTTTQRSLTEVLANLPPEWPEDLQGPIAEALRRRREKLVVLDDDPTGCQTSHGVSVLTDASVDALRRELDNDLPACFILTNSRSLPAAEAEALNAEIGRRLKAAAAQAAARCIVVSRSDSTLRGHFPGEVQALAEALGESFDAWLLIPFFQEGGRYTFDDVHYVAEGDVLTPAGETDYARDAAFGYRASNLRDWVAEKTGGRIPVSAVASVSLDDLRRGGPTRVTERLMTLNPGAVCVVNAASRRDLEVFTCGLLAAEAHGKRFLYRTAASILPVRAGIPPRPLLGPEELRLAGAGGGLLIVGSHVPRSTRPLEHLLPQDGLVPIELDVSHLLDAARAQTALSQAAQAADAALQAGQDVVLYTSRQVQRGTDAAHSLAIARQVSRGLVRLIQTLRQQPRYLLAKGGITACDLATRGLGVQRALVLGQILPGVPVWQLGAETRFPGLPFIVFPGNVGGPAALRQIVDTLRVKTD